VFGDDIYIGLSLTGGHWSRDISVLDCTGTGTGRNGISITAGQHIVVRSSRWSRTGFDTFDIEPNGGLGGAGDVLFARNEIGQGLGKRVLTITGRGRVSDVTFRDNRLTGQALTMDVELFQQNERPQNISVMRNVSTRPFQGPGPAALLFHNTDGVTVTGNVQPIRVGRHLTLAAAEGSTRVAVAGSYQPLGPPERWWRRRLFRYGLPLVLAAALLTLVVGRWWRRRRRRQSGFVSRR
jgi:hypothetical protein